MDPAPPDPRDADGVAHLRGADPILRELIDRIGPPRPRRRPDGPPPDDHYGALVRAIVGQQLSVKAARAIHGRLLEQFGGRPPLPAELLERDPEALRGAVGLSRAKVSFLRSLAEHVVSGELRLEELHALPDEEVVAELVAVKGLGEWTAHMFLMFHLERPDVLAVGDLGVRRAVQRAYGMDDLPSADALREMGEAWAPWRSLACRYLWRSLDEDATPD